MVEEKEWWESPGVKPTITSREVLWTDGTSGVPWEFEIAAKWYEANIAGKSMRYIQSDKFSPYNLGTERVVEKSPPSEKASFTTTSFKEAKYTALMKRATWLVSTGDIYVVDQHRLDTAARAIDFSKQR